MATADNVPRGDVAAPLNYYQPPKDNSTPYNYIDESPGVELQRNYSLVPVETTIHDIRGREFDFTLDHDAFQVIRNVPPSKETEFIDDKSIEEKYYPEVEKLLLDNIPGSNRIILFDHTIRRSGPNATRSPVLSAHVDQTLTSAVKRVRRHSPEDADALLQGRYRIVNVWRPLNKNPVESLPLAVASAASVPDEDIVAVEHRYSNGYLGETASLKPSPTQKWYYLSGMTGDERLFLECFDSESLKPGSKIKGRAPHTAFEDPRTRPDAEGRESIEVRALVFGP